MNETQSEIEQLKAVLMEAQKERRHKEEYEALSKIINQHPPRAQTLQYVSCCVCGASFYLLLDLSLS